MKTYINGIEVARNATTLIPSIKPEIKNNFNIDYKDPSDFFVKFMGNNINIIVAIDGQLITERLVERPLVSNGKIISDVDKDIIKIVTSKSKWTDANLAWKLREYTQELLLKE